MMSKDPLLLLFDGDMIVFEVTSSLEKEIKWDTGIHTLHSEPDEAEAKVDEKVKSLTQKVLDKLNYSGAYEIIMCFTDSVNFRKKIYPLYKANRTGKRKPLCYVSTVEWVKNEYTCYQKDGLEADDCLGILATLKPNTVIISGDKDFKSIPGRFFDYLKGVMYEVSEEEADKAHMFQTLIGDRADNYPGCPGMGEVTANKVLAEDSSWPNIVKQFEKKKLTEEDAILQARVARILRKEDYNFKTKEPILWEPKK